jgi:hypothetical protein
MGDLESIRDLAKRLVAEYRAKQPRITEVDPVAARRAEVLDELFRDYVALSFDAQLTEKDRKWLRCGRIKP